MLLCAVPNANTISKPSSQAPACNLLAFDPVYRAPQNESPKVSELPASKVSKSNLLLVFTALSSDHPMVLLTVYHVLVTGDEVSCVCPSVATLLVNQGLQQFLFF